MSERGDLLELMYGARARWVSVRLALRSWRHAPRQARALERFARGRARRPLISAYTHSALADEHESRVRLWMAGECVREERAGAFSYPELSVRDGARWWTYSQREGATSNEHHPELGSGIGSSGHHLLDPAGLIGALRLERDGSERAAGRPALRVRAWPRPGATHAFPRFETHALGVGADGYELLVDAERGVLLRTAALLDDQPFFVDEVLEIAFDEEFAPELFRCASPHPRAQRESCS